MITDSSIREQGYIYFLEEAPELLQAIEEDLFTLAADFSTAKVHNLMRATHTIKGGAANVGLEVINKIAHSLEDIFKSLYSPEVELDTELQTLLFQAFECLQLPVTAEISGTNIDADEILQRAATVFAQLQDKLGDAFGAETYIPTSEELGFDIVLSIFETGVSQRIDSIGEVLENPPENDELADFLRTQAEVFLGLAESLNLPGFGAIAQAMADALSLNGDRAFEVGTAVLGDLQQAREAVKAGDRVQGGEVSVRLTQLASQRGGITEIGTNNLNLPLTGIEIISSEDNEANLDYQEIPQDTSTPDISYDSDALETLAIDIPSLSDTTMGHAFPSIHSSRSLLRQEIEAFYNFLTQAGSGYGEVLRPASAKFYLKAIRYILGWFNHELDIPESDLGLNLLVPTTSVDEPIVYIENWLSELFIYLDETGDSPSLSVYRQGIIYTIVLAIAKFLNAEQEVFRGLKAHIRELGQEYKNYPPVTSEEKNWLNTPKLKRLLEIKQIPAPNDAMLTQAEVGIEAIWGEEIDPTSASQASQQEVNQVDMGNIYDESTVIEDIAPYLDSGESSTITAELSTTRPTETIVTTAPPSQMPTVVNATNSNPTSDEKPNQPNARQRSFVRVDVDSLHRLNYLAGELLIYQKRRNLLDDQLRETIEKLFSQLTRHQETLSELRDIHLQGANLPDRIFGLGKFPQSFASHPATNGVSVNFDALEMDEYTEYQLALHSALEEALQLQETAESLDVILQSSVLVHDKKQTLALNIIDNLVEARMSPLGNILNRFPQMIQNLANVYKKRVEMKLFGTQVLVDKAIAEKLYDPLLHIVRNAFDHGLETPEARRAQNKSEVGTIEIRAYHQGSQTIIEVRDDGKGLNFERIREKGMELGLLNTSQPGNEDLIDLLFSPGFSTAGKVSEISGRGMGLDIVKTQLRALNGDITLYSRPNQGTTFILKIPFSMTTEQLMLVQAGGATYALLLDSIEKIVLPSSQQVKELEGRKVLHWHNGKDDQMLGLRNLSELMHYNSSFVSGGSLGSSNTTIDSQDINNPILVLQNGSELLGLEVDQIIGEQELVIRPLGNAIAPPKYVYGCSSLANGNLILVIDGALILESNQNYPNTDTYYRPAFAPANQPALPISRNETTTAYLETDEEKPTGVKLPSLPSSEPTTAVRPWVLVVDDAISLRQTISLTLQKYGYQVIQAQNGIEALEQLQRHSEVSLVVSDLEMPRMNGFELLSNIRQNPKLQAQPVIILTSRSAEKHRQLATALGATAYLTKPYLEHELLATVEGVLTNKAATKTTKLLSSAV